MCLAVPSMLVEIHGYEAIVEVMGGARKGVNLMLLGDDVAIGDYVLVHAGFAIQKVETEHALESQRFITEFFADGDPLDIDSSALESSA